MAPYLLRSVLAAFARTCPTITVNIREDLTHSLPRQLAEGELDLALLSLPVRRPDLISEPLFTEPMLLAVPTRHQLWRLRRPVRLQEVAQESSLLLRDGHCFRDDVLQICKRERLNPRVVFEGGQFDTLLAMVAVGAGITPIPEMVRLHYRRVGAGLLEFLAPNRSGPSASPGRRTNSSPLRRKPSFRA